MLLAGQGTADQSKVPDAQYFWVATFVPLSSPLGSLPRENILDSKRESLNLTILNRKAMMSISPKDLVHV